MWGLRVGKVTNFHMHAEVKIGHKKLVTLRRLSSVGTRVGTLRGGARGDRVGDSRNQDAGHRESAQRAGHAV